MNNLIERYVREVTRRLPESEREEVGRELTANIADMLPADAGEDGVRAALLALGPPAQLAEKYRQRPRYLISPAIFDEYTGVLKLVLTIVVCVTLIAGLALGAVEAISAGEWYAGDAIGAMLSRALEMALGGVFQAAVWTTVAFAAVDRVRGGKADGWSPDDLPELPAKGAKDIPLSGSIVELALTAVFAAIMLLMCVGVIGLPIVVSHSGVNIPQVFDESFLRACIPVIAITAALGACEYVCKIAARRWTPLVCAFTVISNAANIGGAVYLATRPVILSAELRALIDSWQIGEIHVYDTFLVSLIGGNRLGAGSISLAVFAAIVIIASLWESGAAVCKTVKAARGK